MARYAGSCNFLLPEMADMQPKKVFLAPPGLADPPSFIAPPGFGSPPGFHASCLTVPDLPASPGVDVLLDANANPFSPANLENQLPMRVGEYERLQWHACTLADQASWDELYENCTAAVLSYDECNMIGQTMSLCAATRCSAKSDVSEETDSTVDTVHIADQEQMVHEVIIDSFSKALLAGGEEQQNAIDCIIDQLQIMCRTQQGSLLVQSALVLATDSQLEALSVKLSLFSIDACKSPHGNHVVQKCIDVLGHKKAQIIIDALHGKAVALARDRFGCRIMQHLVEVCPEEQVSDLIDDLMKDAARLCRHPFANYVMQSVVKNGTPVRVAQVADVLSTDAPGFSRHRFAKHVFLLAVEHGEPADQTRLMVASKRPIDFFTK